MTDAWASLIQTGVWLLAIGSTLLVTRRRSGQILDALVQRIVAGAPIGLGPVNIGSPPAALKRGQEDSATSEGSEGAALGEGVAQQLADRTYPSDVSDDVYLLHATQVLRPRSDATPGLFRVRVWLETDPPGLLDGVSRVTYRLHHTFSQRVIATEARGRSFELWMNIIGEFTIVAYVERVDKPPLWMTRYLDLPGRPPE
jgi:hypothetical protein